MKFRIRQYHLFIFVLFFYACNNEEEPQPISPLEEAYENSNTWNWVAKDEMISRSGQTTGYAVNFNKNSTKLLLYLEGGGVCFNAVTCFQNPNKFNEEDFKELISNTGGDIGMYNRSSSLNPFNDWNFVYVPYTTGDIHGGNNMSSDIPGGLNDQVMVGSQGDLTPDVIRVVGII